MSKIKLLARVAKQQSPHARLYIAGALILLGSGLVWWFGVRTQPERVFAGMLEQSLMTSGVTVQASQGGGGSNIDYTLQYSLGANNVARSLTVVEQPGSKVTTETIGTLDTDFTRYKDIEIDQSQEAGGPVDIGNIEGVWAKTDKYKNALLGQAVLGLSLPLGALPVPIANLQPEARQKLLDQIKSEKVYEVDYDSVQESREDGRLQYTYKVRMQVILYAHLMKKFAASIGLHEFDDLDPNQYSSTEPVEFEMTVDVSSRHLTKVQIPDQGGGRSYVQTFSGYGIPVTIDPPQEGTISNTELQRRLQEL